MEIHFLRIMCNFCSRTLFRRKESWYCFVCDFPGSEREFLRVPRGCRGCGNATQFDKKFEGAVCKNENCYLHFGKTHGFIYHKFAGFSTIKMEFISNKDTGKPKAIWIISPINESRLDLRYREKYDTEYNPQEEWEKILEEEKKNYKEK